MTTKPYRQHTPEFKLQVCREIRAGEVTRLEAQRRYRLSANLIQTWLVRFDKGDLPIDGPDPTLVIEYEAKIAALERKVGQLTMELVFSKKRLAWFSWAAARAARSSAAPRLLHPPRMPSDRAAAQYLLLPAQHGRAWPER